VNTQLGAGDYAFMLADSRARAVVVSAPILPAMAAAVATLPPPQPEIIVSGDRSRAPSFAARLEDLPAAADAPPTHPAEACFWVSSSGPTGRPKGTVHLHRSLVATAERYAIAVLGIGAEDVVYSAAKLFFAYGLGNALTFPLYVGATSILAAERP